MTTLNIRNIDEQTVERLKRSAAARGMTLPQYIARLADLHDMVRQWADNYEDDPHSDAGTRLQTELEAIGMQTVSR